MNIQKCLVNICLTWTRLHNQIVCVLASPLPLLSAMELRLLPRNLCLLRFVRRGNKGLKVLV